LHFFYGLKWDVCGFLCVENTGWAKKIRPKIHLAPKAKIRTTGGPSSIFGPPCRIIAISYELAWPAAFGDVQAVLVVVSIYNNRSKRSTFNSFSKHSPIVAQHSKTLLSFSVPVSCNTNSTLDSANGYNALFTSLALTWAFKFSYSRDKSFFQHSLQ
jgi:hypothetical protein